MSGSMEVSCSLSSASLLLLCFVVMTTSEEKPHFSQKEGERARPCQKARGTGGSSGIVVLSKSPTVCFLKAERQLN